MRKVILSSSAGGHVLDLELVTGCHWEEKGGRRRLVVHQLSGRVDLFEGDTAARLFDLIAEGAESIDSAALQVR